MSENLIFFIKQVVSGEEGIASSHALLKIEPIAFQGQEIKEILIEDLTGLQNWMNTLPGTEYFWTTSLIKKVNYLKMEINNFSIKSGRLEIKDEIKKGEIAIPQLDNLQEFSVFYQPSFKFGFGNFSITPKHDGSKDFMIKDLVDFSSGGVTYPISSIEFKQIDENFSDQLRIKLMTVPHQQYNPRKMAVKITVRGLGEQNTLTLKVGSTNFGTERDSLLELKNITAENIEIGAPFSRLENPTNSPPKKPAQENQQSKGETGNDQSHQNTNDNEENEPNIPKPNQQPPEPGKDNFDSNQPDRKNPEKLNEEIEAEINQQSSQKATNINDSLKRSSEAEDIDQKLAALADTDKNLGDQSYQSLQEEIYSQKRAAAEKDIQKYCRSVTENLKIWMSTNEVNETDLEAQIRTDYQKLSNNQIKEVDLVIQSEQIISQKVGEAGAQKRFKNLVNQIKTALNLKNPAEVEKSIASLIRFTKSSNIFDQALFLNRKPEIENYQTQLENFEANNNPTNFPWKYILPILAGLAVAVLAIIITIYQRKKRLAKSYN